MVELTTVAVVVGVIVLCVVAASIWMWATYKQMTDAEKETTKGKIFYWVPVSVGTIFGLVLLVSGFFIFASSSNY